MNGIFFPIYFVTVILESLANHKVLYIYFVTGHWTEFSFQLEELFSPEASFGRFASALFWGSSPGNQGWLGGYGGWLALPSSLGKKHFTLRSIQGSISKQNIFPMKEFLLRQLVFLSGITECTSQQIQNNLLFKTWPFPTRSTTNALLFSHLGHVGKCVLRELAGCLPGEGARLDECSRAGAWLILVCLTLNSC